MSRLTLTNRSALKELHIEDVVTSNQLSKLIQSVFQIKQEVLGIADQFGKFYDLNYASKHIKTLSSHKFSIVTTKDAADNISFGSRQSLKNQFIHSDSQKCLGIVNNLQKFRIIMPRGVVILITLASDQKIGDAPFSYYLYRGQKKWLEIWNNRELIIECERGNDWGIMVKAIAHYLRKHNEYQMQLLSQNEFTDVQTKKTMILQAFDQIYRDGIISELQFYKKKVCLFERPEIYIRRYLSGETIDRSLLFQNIREDVVKTKDQARVLGKISSEKKFQIPILVRKSTNVIEKVTTSHTFSAEQEQILNLLLELQLKGLITQAEMQTYQKHLLNQNHRLFQLFHEYVAKEIDQISFAKELKKLFRNRREQKKLILS